MPDISLFLKRHGLKLNTNLGQHFLADDTVLEKIVEAAKIQPDDHVIEIGPGIGVLTVELLKATKNVTSIELDERLIPLLRKYIDAEGPKPGTYTFNVIQGNALNVPMPDHPYKIVANIPYHITSPLLRHVFLESKIHPTSMTLLIQREVADKICDTEKTGMLTIVVGLFGTPKKIVNVPPKAFLPPPAVDSAVIHIDCFPNPVADAETIDEVLKLVKRGFTMKRKMLRNSFSTFPGGMERLEAASIDPSRRPETLTIAEWIAIARA
ncbi:ribosomal RNA small subunit methyltransferase A [Candidatus Peregrinibacteria bacterium]|nr:ribosomal RNA small subunit methyltransferase A [Candidatus Peregrinibacteria bacterium]